jgi:hypothetical protein
MGSNSASTGGGGGGVGPAGIKKDGTYGTLKDAKKTSRRNELRTFIKEGGVTGAIMKDITGKTPYERNLERRKKFIKNKGLTSDDINMNDSYLGSKEGLAELKKQGYTTASDTINTGSGNDNNGNQVVQAPTEAVAMSPTEAEVSQSSTAQATPEDDILLRKRKTKSKGRSATIMTGVTGDTEGLTLGKKSLLGS